jgi:neutral ceramidase
MMKALLCLVFGLASTRSNAEPLLAGVAVVDITPPVPYRMSGYFSERLSTGIKDPLKAKAIVFRQGDESAALVFCDLIGISPDVADRTRAHACEATGIPKGNIAITATHSHTGPLYAGALRAYFHERAMAEQGEDSSEKVDYPAQLTAGLVKAITEANAAVAEVNISAGYAEEARLSFNRRFHMKDGEVRFNPGQQNPNIVRVAGPTDPKVGLVLLLKPGEKPTPKAALVSFALHLDTTGGTEYSGDYPRFLEEKLRASLGPDFVSLFGAGTCGDLNHIDVTRKDRRTCEEIGAGLGETVAAALPGLASVGEPSLAVRGKIVEVLLQEYTPEEIARARKDMAKIGKDNLPFLGQVKAYSITDTQARGGNGATVPLEVQAFRLSPKVAIVTLPGEVFVELGLAIRAASSFETTLVIELSNDAPGYLPTEKAFGEGSYETVNSRIQPGGAEKMAEAAISLLKELAEDR